MAGNLRDFVDRAMAYCWDETYGYQLGGFGDAATNYTFDCSGLIGKCLYQAGFNYPSYHVGTADMVANSMTPDDWLGRAGFQEFIYTGGSFTFKPGDIVVMNHLDWSGGHAFIYMEGVYAYTSRMSGSSVNYPNTKGTVSKCKIEASNIRSWNVSTHDDPNPNGACTEVWVHDFDAASMFGNYRPSDPGDQIVIARWPAGMDDYGIFPTLAALLLYGFRRSRHANNNHRKNI